MTVRARRYDARGDDRDIDIAEIDLEKVDDKTLFWIDVDDRSGRDFEALIDKLQLEPRITQQLEPERRRPRMVRQPERISVTLLAVERNTDRDELEQKTLDLITGRNHVVTVHDGPVRAIDVLDDQLRDERDLGLLDAGALLTGLVDVVIAGYLGEVEAIEREVDRLDDEALRAATDHDTFLASVVTLRHRIAVLRRSLTPNRDALMPLIRPDFDVHNDILEPWPGIVDRLERAIDAVETARGTLVGSLEIYLGRKAQHSNDVMKVLTLVSAITLPAIILAGVMGMNFQLPFFENPGNFFIVVGTMAIFAAALLGVARWRHWI